MVITEKEIKIIKITNLRITILFFISLISFGIFIYLVKDIFNLNIINYIFFLISLTLSMTSLILVFILFPLSINIFLIFFLTLIVYLIFTLFLNNQIILYYSILFFILNIFAYIDINNTYKNSLKIVWQDLFKKLWNLYSISILIFIFLYLVFIFNISDIKKDRIGSFIENSKFLFRILNIGIMPETKISDLIIKNLKIELDEKTKEEAIKLAIYELNKRFNLNLKADTTIKEAFSEYLLKQIEILKANQEGLLFLKILIGLLAILIIKPIFYLLGTILSFFSLISYYLFKILKLFEIKTESAHKEIFSV